MKLSNFYRADDMTSTSYPYTSLPAEFALLRAMANNVKELELTPDEFITCMRYAINADLYHQVSDETGTYPTILAMKIIVI